MRDLWSNKTRTVLVLLSIAVGVTAIGMVMGSQITVDRSLPDAFAAVNPASARVFTINYFDDKMVEAVEAMSEVDQAEARRMVNVRFLTKDGDLRSLQLMAIPDYDDIGINKIRPETGAYPPPRHQLLIERASLAPSLGLGGFEIGDTLMVESPSGKQRPLLIAGTVHDMSQLPAFMNGAGYGYITFDTLEWLDEPREFNELIFTVAENPLDQDHINEVSKLDRKTDGEQRR